MLKVIFGVVLTMFLYSFLKISCTYPSKGNNYTTL